MARATGSGDRRAIAAKHFERGSALLKAGELEAATEAFIAALAADPSAAEAQVNLGYVAQRQGRLEPAVAAYEKAIVLAPGLAAAHFNLGNVCLLLGQLERAAAEFGETFRLDSACTAALLNLATVRMRQNRPDEAEAVVRQAIALRPGWAEAYANLGDILLNQHRLAEAQEALARAVSLGCGRPEVPLNQGYAHLLGGDLAAGWPKFEARWSGAPAAARWAFAGPPWLGREPVAGRTILVHSDAGMGDMIQFARYGPLLAERGATVHFEVPAALAPLFVGLPFLRGVHRRGDPLPAFDLHTPFMSLALAFDTTLETIPPPLALAASPVARAAWQGRLGPARRPRVGLVWAGDPGHRADHNRSIPFDLFRRMSSSLPEIEFFSLQNKVRSADAAGVAGASHIVDLAPFGIGAFDDTAAIVAEMDLIVSCDTAIAHLAATMGKPVWLLLPHFPDWRWLLDRDDTPWYPTMRLFRQPRRTDWEAVVKRVREELAAFGGKTTA